MNQLKNKINLPYEEVVRQSRNNNRVIVNAMFHDFSRNFNNSGRPIYFDSIPVDVGGGMRRTYFEVPHSGIYRFTFSATTGTFEHGLTVVTVKEGIDVFTGKVLEIRDGNKSSLSNNMSYTWMRSLQQGVQVSFYVTENYLRTYWNIPITFTAELVAI